MTLKIKDFKNANGLWAKSISIGGIQYNTISGSMWRDMNSRCRSNGSAQKHRQKYEGCFTSDNFKNFQYFVGWHIEQIGYGVQGYQLDKDILFPNNKKYGENSCVLIPQALNCFLTADKKNKGLYAQGVSWQKSNQKFRAEINVDNVRKYIGLYLTEEDAFSAYKIAKEAEAYRWYGRLKAGEFIVDQRVIERMRTWKLE